MGDVPANTNSDPVLRLLPRNDKGCPRGTACGQCGVCRHRARVAVAARVMSTAQAQRKGIGGVTSRKRAHARLMWALEALALVPEDAPQDVQDRIRDSAVRSEAMLAIGQKGTMYR